MVWFGELPHGLDAIERALERCDRFLAVGTSGRVWPAAGLLALARAVGAATWVTGLEAPDNLGPLDTFLPGRAAAVLPGLVERWLSESWEGPPAGLSRA